MEFVRSAAPLTLRHYSIDLHQAYKLEKGSPFLKEATEDLLLAESRRALQAWGRLSLASRNRKIATLKSFLGWVFDEGLIERDLAQLLHCPSVPKKIPHFISVDECLSVLHCFDLSKKGQEQARLLFLLLSAEG
jgi:integrase/recombinase XerC/integrase/recombinase XerD